jgi:hypothetical protein
MEWHWGNIGSTLAGLSTVIIAVAALIRAPAALRDWRARQRALAEAAREEAKTIRLERDRGLSGWSPGMVAVYNVSLVTQEDELERAVQELASGQLSDYVILRVAEGAASLRHLIGQAGRIGRAPTAGELEALEKGLDAMGIRHVGSAR